VVPRRSRSAAKAGSLASASYGQAGHPPPLALDRRVTALDCPATQFQDDVTIVVLDVGEDG